MFCIYFFYRMTLQGATDAFIVWKGRAKHSTAKFSPKVTDQKEEDKGKDKHTQRTVRKE